LAELRLGAADILANRSGCLTAMAAVTSLLPALSQADVARLMERLEAMAGTRRADVPPSLTWPMIHEMRGSVFTIGSHTKSHASLPMESPDVVARELEG